MSFSSLGLVEPLSRVVAERGYTAPTKIQKEMIPTLLKGRDILASAYTGTGKSAAFILPIVQMIAQNKKESSSTIPIRALILVPTKELARQLGEHTEAYCRYMDIKSMAISGGVTMSKQSQRLQRGVDLLISTPGRVLEHARQKNIDLSSVDHFVLDEADTILDMGFIKEIAEIIHRLKEKRQNIFVSATLTHSIKELSREILHRPIDIEIAPIGKVSEKIQLSLIPVEEEKKLELLSYLIGSRHYKQVLVFIRKKAEVESVTKELQLAGLKTAAIHGDKSSGARSRLLRDFKDGKITVLVATDIAARGLDIKGLSVVISYDIPHVTQDFIHRIGRTGRAGERGVAITLSTPQEAEALKLVERLLGHAIPRESIAGYELTSKPILKENLKTNQKKRVAGAFGKKRENKTTKKRKTTKRDRWR